MRYYLDAAPIIYLVEQINTFAKMPVTNCSEGCSHWLYKLNKRQQVSHARAKINHLEYRQSKGKRLIYLDLP